MYIYRVVVNSNLPAIAMFKYFSIELMDNFKATNINYTYLVSLDTEFISNNISKECAFGIFTKAIESDEITAGDVLNLWVKKLKTVYKYENFCRSDWGLITLCCQSYFEKITFNVSSDIDDKTYNQLSCWLKDSSEFLKSIHISDDKFHLIGICLFLEVILDFTKNSCRIFAINDSIYDSSQIERINSLYNLSHKLVWNCLGFHGHINVMEYHALFHYINGLCSNIAIDTFIELKTKVEAWKFVAKFILKYGSHAKKYKHLEENVKWPKLLFRILLREVEISLIMIYKRERKEDEQYVGHHFRVITFYLEILYRITTVFKHSEFPEAKMLFDVSVFSLAPSFPQKSNLFTCIQKHVLPGFTNILSLVYKNNEFQKLISNHIGGRDYCYEFIAAYLCCCITNHDNDLFASSVELIIEIFKRVFQGLDVFVDADRFDEVIDVYVTLTLLDSSGTMLRNMQYLVIKGDSALSVACTELLVLVSSCKESSAGELKDGLQFWMETNHRFAQFSSNFRRLNVERLIGHYIILYSRLELEENTEHHAIFVQNNYNPNRCINNGINHQTEVTKVISELSKSIEIFDRTGMSLEDYYKFVSQMYELVKYKAEVSDWMQQKIAELLSKVCKFCFINAKPTFKRFMSAGLLFMANNKINAETQLKIITYIKDYIHNGLFFPMLSFWLIIDSFRKQKVNLIVRNIAEAVFTQLDIPDIIQVSTFKIAFDASPNFAGDFIHFVNTANNGAIQILRPTFVHRKRPRKDVDQGESEIEDTIQSINLMLEKMTMLSKQLRDSDFVKLNKICDDIKKITDCHNSVE